MGVFCPFELFIYSVQIHKTFVDSDGVQENGFIFKIKYTKVEYDMSTHLKLYKTVNVFINNR